MAKKTSTLFGIVMAGGTGERFWPASRSHLPKQCLSIVGEGTMIQQTVGRLLRLIPPKQIMVITRRGIDKTIASQCRALPSKNIVAEPKGRDTAACLVLAACLVYRQDPDGVMVVSPSDHVVRKPHLLLRSFRDAGQLANKQGALITFGIPPWEPATGYGYVQAGARVRAAGKTRFYRVRRFVEKPNAAKAKRLVAAKGYWWNSGMFVWTAKTFLEEVHRYLPRHSRMAKALLHARSDAAFSAIVARVFPSLPKISVDYGIMERSRRVLVGKARFGWDDLGSWSSLQPYFETHGSNALRGHALAVRSTGNIVHAQGSHFVGLFGVKDLVVVHTPDATLVCKKENAQQLKELVGGMRKSPRLRRWT